MSVHVNGRFFSAMKLTCWVWLVALGSAGVANAEIPQIQCGGQGLLITSTADTCNAVAAAFNKLDGVSGVTCYYNNLGTDTSAECNAVAAAFNKLDGGSDVRCKQIGGNAYLEVFVGSDCDAAAARLTAILQGPTCKHGNPVSGPTGGEHCISCDPGWQGNNCDSPKYPPGGGHCASCDPGWQGNNCDSPAPTCIVDGCVTGDITKNDAKKHCCHSGHETNRCKGTHWRCDPPTALRGRAFEFPQQQV